MLYRCGRTIGHLTLGDFAVMGVALFLSAFLVSSWKMNGKAEGRWLGTSSCDIELTIALRTYALRAYDGKSSDLIPPGPRSRVGTRVMATLVERHLSRKSVMVALSCLRRGSSCPISISAACTHMIPGLWVCVRDVRDHGFVAVLEPVSYTHLTLPTICSV